MHYHPPTKQVEHRMYYDDQNKLTTMSSNVSGGGKTVGVACLAWLAVMEVFPPPLLFSLLYISFHANPLKIQMCHLVCICFKFASRSFEF
jgi:hypothetical protein